MSKVYPLWLEKLVFIILVGASIYTGMMLPDYIDGIALWISWTCGMPIIILFLTEVIGRLIQKIHISD